MGMTKSAAVLISVLSLFFTGTMHSVAQADDVTVSADFEHLESKTLSDGWGTLRLWRNKDNGCLHADVINAPSGVVAMERVDGTILAVARNPHGGSATTAEVHMRNGDVRGAMRTDSGRTTLTKWYGGASLC
jgi:hypothetical protein